MLFNQKIAKKTDKDERAFDLDMGIFEVPEHQNKEIG
jgi:hypothetical protein